MASEVSLTEIGRILWSFRRFIAIVAAAAVILAGTYGFFATPMYRSEALLAPADEMANRGTSALSSLALGAVASLSGLLTAPDIDEVMAIMRSRDFATAMLLEERVIEALFEEEWDAEKGQWKNSAPDSSADLTSGTRFERALQRFRQVYRVDLDRTTNFVRVSAVWKDPALAQQWVTTAVQRVNEVMRTRDIEEAERTLSFLKERIDEEQNVELKASMVSLYQQQLEKAMLAEVRTQYSVRVLDPPYLSARAVSPRRVRIVAAALVFSLVFASAGVLLFCALRSVRQ